MEFSKNILQVFKVEFLWVLTTELVQIFNERAARRSRSTSRFGCGVSRIACRLNNLNNLNNFKVQLRWLPLTESTQIFLCDSVCVSSNRKSKIENRKKKSKIENRKKKLKRWTLVSHKVDPSPGGT